MRCISSSKICGSVYTSRRTRSGSTHCETSGMFSRSMGFFLRYVRFQVGAHAPQYSIQRGDVRLRETSERQRVEPLHGGPYPLEHPPSGGGEREARNAHVDVVG